MKRTLFFIIVAVCLLIINNLAHSIVTLWQKQEFLITAQATLKREEQRQQKLQQQYKVVSGKQYIDEQARNKLSLLKPGEEMVLLPTGMLSQSSQTNSDGSSLQLPHWQEWWNYFFN